MVDRLLERQPRKSLLIASRSGSREHGRRCQVEGATHRLTRMIPMREFQRLSRTWRARNGSRPSLFLQSIPV